MSTSWQILISNSASKSVKKIPQPWKSKIIKTLHYLAINPHIGEKLKGDLNGSLKLVIWPYRIIYTIIERRKIVYIEKVSHRQGVYK